MPTATADPTAMANLLAMLQPAAATNAAPTIAPPMEGQKGIDWGTIGPLLIQVLQASSKGYQAPAKDFSPTGKDFWSVFNQVAPIVLQTVQAMTKAPQGLPTPSAKAFDKDFLSDLTSVLPYIVQTVQVLSKGGIAPPSPNDPESKGFWDTFRQVVSTVGQVAQVAGPIIAAVA